MKPESCTFMDRCLPIAVAGRQFVAGILGPRDADVVPVLSGGASGIWDPPYRTLGRFTSDWADSGLGTGSVVALPGRGWWLVVGAFLIFGILELYHLFSAGPDRDL